MDGGNNMVTVKVSSKYQVMTYGDRVELIPIRKIQSMRGFLKGIDSSVEREEDRL